MITMSGPVAGTNVLKEVNSSHEFHGEEPILAVSHELIKGHQIGVRHVGERAKLVFKARDVGCLSAGESLQRNHLVRLAIMCLIDHSHSSGAKPAANLEAFGAEEIAGVLTHLVLGERAKRCLW